ncbi:MAG: C4-dicarboxylate ABC transporter permease, partial [Burkholderiales bacterium]|nr:C4-dicarboxylate ABC transporter permease [Burkholderiales bacterium]
METFSSLLVVIVLIALVVGAGVWIFVGIGLVGALSLFFLRDYSLDRIGLLLQSSVWNGVSSWELSAIPLFIWMGEIL